MTILKKVTTMRKSGMLNPNQNVRNSRTAAGNAAMSGINAGVRMERNLCSPPKRETASRNPLLPHLSDMVPPPAPLSEQSSSTSPETSPRLTTVSEQSEPISSRVSVGAPSDLRQSESRGTYCHKV